MDVRGCDSLSVPQTLWVLCGGVGILLGAESEQLASRILGFEVAKVGCCENRSGSQRLRQMSGVSYCFSTIEGWMRCLPLCILSGLLSILGAQTGP